MPQADTEHPPASGREGVLHDLEAVLRGRLEDPPPDSYSATLLADPEQAVRKIMEESFELCLELGRCGPDESVPDRQRVVEEAADVFFHVLAGLVGAGVELADVLAELAARRG